MNQTMIPGIHVEASGEAARRMLASVNACAGFNVGALEAGVLGEIISDLLAFYERGEVVDPEREMYLLERLGVLGGGR